MKKLINFLIEKAWIFAVVLLLTGSSLLFIVTAASYPDNFVPIIAHTFYLVIRVGLFISIPICLLIIKDKAARVLTILVCSYFFIDFVINNLLGAEIIVPGVNGVLVVSRIFLFLEVLLLISSVVFFIMFKNNENKDNFYIAALLVFVGLIMSFFGFVFQLIYYAIVSSEGLRLTWTAWISPIIQYILLPWGLFFAFLLVEKDKVVEEHEVIEEIEG